MIDILSNGENFIMQDGDFATVEGVEKVKQHIITALNTFYSDWIIDKEKGIDFVNGLKNTDLLDADARKQILEIKDVLGISYFCLSFNKSTLTVDISATIQTEYGDISINDVLGNRS